MKRVDIIGRLIQGHIIFMMISLIIGIQTINTTEGRELLLTTGLTDANRAALNPGDYDDIKNDKTDDTLFDAITKALNVDLWVGNLGSIIGLFTTPYWTIYTFIQTQTNTIIIITLTLLSTMISYLYFVYPLTKLIFGEARTG